MPEVDLKAAVEEGETPEPEIEEVEAPNYTVEQLEEAKAMGYRDDRDKLPEGKKFVGPVEYMERNPLYKKLKVLEGNFSQLNTHYQKVSEMEFKKAEKEFESKLKTLKAEKVTALDDADHKRVVEIDEEIRATEKPVEAKAGNSQEFESWIKDNDWFNTNKFLQVQAQIVGERLSYDMQGKELLDAVKDHLKRAHPEEFTNSNRSKAAAVESGSNVRKLNGKKPSSKDLTADEATVYKNFKRMGTFTGKTEDESRSMEQKYFEEVIATRE